jgi:hypothetical protein
MNKEHVISDQLLDEAIVALSANAHWIAYNTIPYFLKSGDMYFFKSSGEAHEFSDNNISEYDNYRVLHISSIEELLKRIQYEEVLETEIFNSNLSIMNEKNFEYLKDNIKYMGFGENLNQSLEENLRQGKSDFSLYNSTEVNRKPFEVALNFRKSDNSDMYFFNSYRANLELSNGKRVEQTFYLNRGKGVTAKEAYNLLQGRAVLKELSNKEGEAYKAWIQLDFSKKDKHNNFEVQQFHEKYGYDLRQTLSKFPIAELTDPEKEKALLHSLQKGSIQSVSIQKNGRVEKMFVEANPRYKTITLFDENFKRLHSKDVAQYICHTPERFDDKQAHSKEVKQSAKPTNSNEDVDVSKKKTSHKRKLSL